MTAHLTSQVESECALIRFPISVKCGCLHVYQVGTLAWAVTLSPSSSIVRYLNATSDLLTSVKKTEDSLSKLKRSRRSTVPAASPVDGVSDDNKIRLQIALDVATYAEQVCVDGIVARTGVCGWGCG